MVQLSAAQLQAKSTLHTQLGSIAQGPQARKRSLLPRRRPFKAKLPVRLSLRQLAKDGILVSTDGLTVPPLSFCHAFSLTLIMDQPGFITLTLERKRDKGSATAKEFSVVWSAVYKFEDLLAMQEARTERWELEALATFDFPRMMDIINHRVM